MCEKCPHDGGIGLMINTQKHMLARLRTEPNIYFEQLALFSCKHRVTKNRICAVPCNGIDDLCEYNLDEQCQGPGLLMTFIIICLLSISFLITSSGLSYHKLMRDNGLELANYEVNDHKTKYTYYNDGKNRQYLYLKLSIFEEFKNIFSGVELATSYFSKVCDSNLYEKDHQVMRDLGTNKTSAYFYGCVDNSIAVRANVWFNFYFPNLYLMLKSVYFGVVMIILKGTVSLCLKYSDLSKDILFLYMIWLQLGSFKDGSFPKLVFYTLLVSISLAEVMNMCAIIIHDVNGTWRRKISVAILGPLMPAYYIHKVAYYKISKFITLDLYRDNIEDDHHLELINRFICTVDNKIYLDHLKLARLQCIENVVENLPQLTILFLITLLNQTSSPIVEYLQNIFIDETAYIGWVLALISVADFCNGVPVLANWLF